MWTNFSMKCPPASRSSAEVIGSRSMGRPSRNDPGSVQGATLLAVPGRETFNLGPLLISQVTGAGASDVDLGQGQRLLSCRTWPMAPAPDERRDSCRFAIQLRSHRPCRT